MSRKLPREDYLHYLWRVRDFELENLRTTKGSKISIVRWGEYNRNAGPDFLNAVISVGGVVWSGSVEMHVRASDWKKHNHNSDPNYNNVILHVVFVMDEEITRQDGTFIHTLELKDRVSNEKILFSEFLLNQALEVPCEPFRDKVKVIHWQNWIDRVFTERLESKAEELKAELLEMKYDWDQLFFQTIARSLGQPVNGDAFWELSKRTSVRTLLRLRGKGQAIEAILFGQSGLLGHQDSYAQKLQAEYDHYAKMLGLIPMKPANWRFMRMRPPEFPTRRIAQLAGWIEYGDTRFSTYLNESHFSKIIGKMKFKASDYWVDHVRFGRDTKPMTTEIGNATLSKVVANAILPMFCLYGEITGMPEPKERALLFASEMKAEKNRITRLWKNAPLSVDSLLDSQAVIQLTKEYCRKRRCLECAIGSAILCGHNQNKANADS